MRTRGDFVSTIWGHLIIANPKWEKSDHHFNFGLEILFRAGIKETQRQDMSVVQEIAGGTRGFGDSAVLLAKAHWA